MTKLHLSPELSELLRSISSESIYADILLGGDIDPEDMSENPIDYLGLSTSDPTKLSYLTQDRISKIQPDELWSSTKRYQGKPSVVLSKIFKKVNYQEFEKFTNSIKKSSALSQTYFSVFSGEDLIQWYDEENYDKRTNGSLNSSCMKHKHCLIYFDLYTKNPQTISLLTLMDKISGNLMGRALLWDLGEEKIMDRIYTTNDSIYRNLFKEWAEKEGYYYKLEQNWNTSLWFVWQGKKVYKEFQVKLNTDGIELFPYLDTFKFFDLKNKILYNKNPNTQHIVTMTSSSGSFHPGDHLGQCQEDLNYYNSSDIIFLDYRDISVNRSLVLGSNILNRWIHRDDAEWVEEFSDVVFSSQWEHLNGDLEKMKSEFKDRGSILSKMISFSDGILSSISEHE